MRTSAYVVVWPGQEGIVRSIHRFELNTAWVHGPAVAFAKYGVVVFGLILVWSWWRARGSDLARIAAALWAPLGVLIAVGINQPVGRLFDEPRPYRVLTSFQPLVARTSDFSFPSDHAVMAGAAAMGVLLVNRRLGFITWVLAALMAFTRVYVGAHFLGDVLAGLALGATVSAVGWFLVRRPALALLPKIARGPLASIVG